MTTTAHNEAHEIRILRSTDGDTDAGTHAEIAEQVAKCDDCLAYVAQTVETLVSVRANKDTAHMSALDRLMDDVMVLRAGVTVPRRQLVPAGE